MNTLKLKKLQDKVKEALGPNWVYEGDSEDSYSNLVALIATEKEAEGRDVAEEIGEYANHNGHYIGCVMEDGVWLYQYDNEVCNLATDYVEIRYSQKKDYTLPGQDEVMSSLDKLSIRK